MLRFTYVGFKEKEIAVGNRGILDVTLDEDVEALDEVVVVGYGTQKKASVVGSITNVEPSNLSITPTRSLSNNLAGYGIRFDCLLCSERQSPGSTI